VPAAEVKGEVLVPSEDETVQPSTRDKPTSHTPSNISNLHKTRGIPLGLAQGLSTGHFDVADVKLLRTCSEPDLTQFARPTAVSGNSSDGNMKVRQSISSVMSEDKDLLDEVCCLIIVII